jgi:hypothetical protein
MTYALSMKKMKSRKLRNEHADFRFVLRPKILMVLIENSNITLIKNQVL